MEMTKAFYVVRVREDWYRLHVTTTHYCLGACDNLESLLRTVKRLTKKYRTEQKLLKGLSRMEDCGQVNESSLLIYRGDYKDLHSHYDSAVSGAVKEALEEVRFDTPYHRAMRRTVNRKKTLLTSDVSDEKEVKSAENLKARKPKLKKR